jgi:hypothetical protein
MTREELIKKYTTPIYIGDAVYVWFDGFHFWLQTASDNPDYPSNKIGLEPAVFNNLNEYRTACYRDFEKLSELEGKLKEG